MNKELEQNIAEMREIFRRFEGYGYSVEEKRRFLGAVAAEIDKIDVKTIMEQFDDVVDETKKLQDLVDEK